VILALVRRPHLRRFFFAHGQSQLGTGAAYVALVLIAYHRLHAGWAVALVLLADFVPGILLSVHFGALADRYPRRTLAIAAELLRAGAFAGLALTGSFGATFTLALIAGVGTALFGPAVKSALPNLVDEEERSPATALYGALNNVGITLGPALCAVVLLVGPVEWVLLANAASFLISAVMLAGVPLGRAAARVEELAEPPASAWEDAKLGARYIAGERCVRAVLTVGALSVLCGAVINVAEPLLATGSLHAGGSGYSILVAVYGIGLIAGSVYSSRLGGRIGRLRVNFLVGVCLSGLAMVGCAAAGSLAWALPAFAVAGFANVLIIDPEIRLVQELVMDRFRGRVFGLRDAVQSACFAGAMIAAGAALSAAGPRAVYLIGGALQVGAAVLGWRIFRPAERATATVETELGTPVLASYT
jgi:MFS family permease